MWNYFDSFGNVNKPILHWDDKINIVKNYKWYYENCGRLANKLKNITKKVRYKFRNYDLKEEIEYKGHHRIVCLSEGQWENETNEWAYKALNNHESWKLNQLIDIRLSRRTC
jgi:hypothetical protein